MFPCTTENKEEITYDKEILTKADDNCRTFIFWLFGGELVLPMMGVYENIMPMCLGYMKFFAPTFLGVGIESSFSVIMQT